VFVYLRLSVFVYLRLSVFVYLRLSLCVYLVLSVCVFHPRYFASEPFADLHRVEGLRGVFVATLINGSLSEDNMRSVITFDKGGTWELLQAPSADSLGGTLDCQVAS
jgi:hypothetical protein